MGKGEIARYEQFLIFPQCFQKTCTADIVKAGPVWERVNSFSTQSRLLTTLKKKALENTVGKGENAGKQHFLFSHSVFCSVIDRNHHINIVVCKCF